MNSKAQLIANLKQVYNAWDSLLQTLPESKLVAPEFHDGLSIKDELIHLWAWQQVSIARLEAARDGTEPKYPGWTHGIDPDTEGTLDQNNAEIYNAYCDLPWSEVYNSWKSGFRHLIALAEATPEADLSAKGAYSWMPDYPLSDVLEGTYEHHSEHLEQLQDWLKSQNSKTGATD